MKDIKEWGNTYLADPQEIGQQEREWLENLKIQIQEQSLYSNNLLVKLTWLENHDQLFEWIINSGSASNTKIWMAGSIDSCEWITKTEVYGKLREKGYNMSLVGFCSENWHSWFPYWFYKHNKNVYQVDLNDPPKYLYLSYNRKPREHRKELVQKLIDNNLNDRGWITFDKGIFNVIDDRTASTESNFDADIREAHKENFLYERDDRYTRPEDVSSLGDLNIWNDSYLVIVSESEKHDQWHISEKTWKPIFGLRPFVLNSNPSVSKVLKKLGFYTPSDLFENAELDNCDVDSIIRLIDSLYDKAGFELYTLWQKQLPMLVHNRNRFIEIANCDKTKILNWAQAKSVR